MTKKRRNRSAQRTRKQAEQREQEERARLRAGQYGPADPMPDGTPRKARQDALSYLQGKGILTVQQERAAAEIQEVFISRVGSLLPRAQEYERVDRARVEINMERAIDAGRRYDAWAEWSKRNTADTKINVHELILDVILDGLSLRAADAKFRKKKGTAKHQILHGLHMYAQLSGWIRNVA